MVSVSADDFQAIINDADISNENTEKILDLAIDCLNLYGKLELSNLAGTAGSKTVSVDSQTRGAIYLVARAIYYGFFKGITNVAVSGITATSTDLMSNTAVLDSLKEAAKQLQEVDWSRAMGVI